MRGQIQHLIDLSLRPKVTIQVIPSSASARTTLGHPITLLRFDEDDAPDIAYVEGLNYADYLVDPNRYSHYMKVFIGLVCEALPPNETQDYLRRLLQQL